MELRKSERTNKGGKKEKGEKLLQSERMNPAEEKSIPPGKRQTSTDSRRATHNEDFFLPASKKQKKQKDPEIADIPPECNPVLKERKQKEERLAVTEKGVAGNKSKQRTKGEDFFKPASKKQKQPTNRDYVTKVNTAPKAETRQGNPLFHVDLWKEAKLGAEEHAQLCGGKPTHPFFSQHRIGQKTSIPINNYTNGLSQHMPCLEVKELLPALPFHINQLPKTEQCTADIRSGCMDIFDMCQERKPFKNSFSEVDSSELKCLLKLPSLAASSRGRRRGKKLQRPVNDISIEPLIEFLKNHENQMKDEEKSYAYLEDRFKLYRSYHSRGSSSELTNMQSRQQESSSKNLLWTDVYQPQLPEQVCGNKEIICSLDAWLLRWKTRNASNMCIVDGEINKKKLQNKDDSDDDRGWFEEDWDFEGKPPQVDALQNVLLLAGPVGCGKTTAIYACARAHGYTVIEVNCSDCRSGLLIKQKFSEAMESHRLGNWSADMAAVDQSYTMKQSCSEAINTFNGNSRKIEQANKKRMHAHKDNMKSKRTTASTKMGLTYESEEPDVPIESDKNMTVLLFEDIDMVFEDDRGFMAAVAQVAATAKRPIILTSNNKDVCLPPNLGAQLLEFKRPSTEELVVLAYLICNSEGIVFNPDFLLQIVNVCHHDIRELLNYLQFWCQGQYLSAAESCEENNNDVIDTEPPFDVTDSGILRNLFNLDAQYRLWPVYANQEFPCEFTKLIAGKLNEIVNEAEMYLTGIEEQALLELIKNTAIRNPKKLKKLSKDKEHGSFDLQGDKIDELSEFLETPVKNLKDAKIVARSPILRKKIRRQLLQVSDSDDDDDPDKTKSVHLTPQKYDNRNDDNSSESSKMEMLGTAPSDDIDSIVHSDDLKPNHTSLNGTQSSLDSFEVSNMHSVNSLSAESGIPSSETALPSEASDVSAGGGNTKAKYQSCPNISERVCTLWSQLRNSRNENVYSLSLESMDSLATVIELSNLLDSLSASDVISCFQGSNSVNMDDECGEHHENNCLMQNCAEFTHQALNIFLWGRSGLPGNMKHTTNAVVSEDAMLVAMNDPSALGKYAVSGEGTHLGETDISPSFQEHEMKRLERRYGIEHHLYNDLSARAQKSFRGSSFFEPLTFTSQIARLEQQRIASIGTRRRGRGWQNYLSIHPWNLSKETINILEQFGKFN